MSSFARSHGIARRTLRGWLQGHVGPLGRERKLGPFEETKILKQLLAKGCLQDWKTVQETVWRLSGESISRRSVFRLLQKWGLGPPRAVRGGTTTVKSIPWEQPQDTLQAGSLPLKGMFWQIRSGRGTEGFLLTADESSDELEQVATAIAGSLQGRKKPVFTNHPQLAELLRTALPRR